MALRFRSAVLPALLTLAATLAAVAPTVYGGATDRDASAVQPVAETTPAAGAQTRSGTGTTTRTVSGHWVDRDCVPGTGSSARRDFLITGTRWTVGAAVYADPACTTQLLTFVGAGKYRIGDGSVSVPGAREAFFGFDVKLVTPMVQAVADTMTKGGCGRGHALVGVAQDVSRTGCAPLGIPSVKACPGEYDLLKRAGTELFLGARPADGNLCTPDRRPAALAPGLALS